MRAVIVDDEKHFQDSLSSLIQDHCPSIKLVGFADSVDSGVQLIQNENPDLVFLDVELGNQKSFDILKKIGSPKFQVIFVTAHDHYAINAFRFSAIDYLQKPVVLGQLQEAVSKVERILDSQQIENQLQVLSQNLNQISDQDRKIVLKGQDSLHIVKLSEILWCSAEGSYTSFHLVNGQSVIISKHLKEYENLLSSERFFRVHRSYLVNLNHITRYDRSEGLLIFDHQQTLPVSLKRERMDELLEKI